MIELTIGKMNVKIDFLILFLGVAVPLWIHQSVLRLSWWQGVTVAILTFFLAGRIWGRVK